MQFFLKENHLKYKLCIVTAKKMTSKVFSIRIHKIYLMIETNMFFRAKIEIKRCQFFNLITYPCKLNLFLMIQSCIHCTISISFAQTIDMLFKNTIPMVTSAHISNSYFNFLLNLFTSIHRRVTCFLDGFKFILLSLQ